MKSSALLIVGWLATVARLGEDPVATAHKVVVQFQGTPAGCDDGAGAGPFVFRAGIQNRFQTVTAGLDTIEDRRWIGFKESLQGRKRAPVGVFCRGRRGRPRRALGTRGVN